MIYAVSESHGCYDLYKKLYFVQEQWYIDVDRLEFEREELNVCFIRN